MRPLIRKYHKKKIITKQQSEISEFDIYIDGKYYTTLNAMLAIRRDIKGEALKKIKNLHIEKYRLFEKVKKLTDLSNIKEYLKEYHEIEFKLQDAWGFSRDINYHRFWEFPHCCCPVIDNRERIGYGHFIVNMACPVHGN